MPFFSKISKERLSQCCDDLQILFNFIIQYFDCSVLAGYRGKAEQNKAYEAGKSKLCFPDSKHNLTPSYAADVSPYPIDFNDRERMCYFAGQVMMAARLLKETGELTHDIRWGGDWDNDTDLKDHSLSDLAHYEIWKPNQI